MTRSVQIRPNQSFLDIAIQEHGNLKALIDMAVLNEVSITSILVPGDELAIDTPDTATKKIIDFFKQKSIAPATSLSAQLFVEGSEFDGIGYMAIEDDFIIQ